MWCARLKAPYCGVDWHEGIQELGLLAEKGQIRVNISNEIALGVYGQVEAPDIDEAGVTGPSSITAKCKTLDTFPKFPPPSHFV